MPQCKISHPILRQSRDYFLRPGTATHATHALWDATHRASQDGNRRPRNPGANPGVVPRATMEAPAAPIHGAWTLP